MQRDRLGKEHLDLLSLPTSDDVGLGLDDCARLVASGFMNGARDLARWHVREHFGLSVQGVAVPSFVSPWRRLESARLYFFSSLPPGQT
jgi:hypothetical protein